MGPQCEQLTSARWALGIDSFHAHIVMPEKFLVINGIVGSNMCLSLNLLLFIPIIEFKSFKSILVLFVLYRRKKWFYR